MWIKKLICQNFTSSEIIKLKNNKVEGRQTSLVSNYLIQFDSLTEGINKYLIAKPNLFDGGTQNSQTPERVSQEQIQ